MNVLHLAPVRWFNAEAQYALDLAEEMGRQGHRVAFLGRTGSDAARRAREAGVETHSEAGFGGKGLASLSAVFAAKRLRALLRQGCFDAVEAHRPEGLPLIAWACRSMGVPLVRVRGDMRPVRADPMNRHLHRRILSGVVASNTAIERSLRARLGPLPHLVTIPGGVDEGFFCPEGARAPVREELGFPRNAYLVGILGRLGELKGHDDFLGGAAHALEAGAEAAFVILSKEPSSREAELRNRVAADPRLRGRVGFLGHRSDLPSVLRAFDLGVVASIGSEANCRVGLEWMACGVPVLATRVGVLPDLVAEPETGFLVQPGVPEELGGRIKDLAGSLEKSRRMGEAARRRVVERFTLTRCARSHDAFLRDVLSGFSRS